MTRSPRRHSLGRGGLAPLRSGHEALSAPGRRLDPATRSFFEPRLGLDLGGVRIHDDARAAHSAEALGALAFTLGSDIAFAAGHYAPDTPGGRLLLAHELTHVVQQRDQALAPGAPGVLGGGPAEAEAAAAGERAARGERVQVVERTQPVLARQEGGGEDLPSLDATAVLWFGLASDELRQDAEVDSSVHLALALERIQRHYEAAGESQQILLHGYASVEGDEGGNVELSGRRAIRVKNLLIASGIESRRIVVLAHGPDASLPGLEWNRRVEVELTPAVLVAEFGETEPIGPTPCSCPASTEQTFDDETIRLVESMAEDINRVAAQRGVPPVALAGAIAEEYQARRGIRVAVDGAQDAVLDALWEWQIDVDRYFDIHSKLLNALENDIGAANFNVRTALALVEAGEVDVPGSPPSDPQVELIIDRLLEEVGTIEFTGAYIARAQSLFAPHVGGYDAGFQEAVLVEYFNQGDAYYDRFVGNLAANPGHTPCPGDAGCVVLHNRARLEAALSASPP